MIFELFTEQRYKKASLALYLGMGWPRFSPPPPIQRYQAG